MIATLKRVTGRDPVFPTGAALRVGMPFERRVPIEENADP